MIKYYMYVVKNKYGDVLYISSGKRDPLLQEKIIRSRAHFYDEIDMVSSYEYSTQQELASETKTARKRYKPKYKALNPTVITWR